MAEWKRDAHYLRDDRHRMRYTRGWEKRGDQWTPLEALYVDKVAIQKDILGHRQTKSEITEEERRDTQQELSSIYRRWGSERGQNVSKREKDLCRRRENGSPFMYLSRLGGMCGRRWIEQISGNG